MTQTIWGIVGKIGNTAEHRDSFGLAGGHSFRSVDLKLGGHRVDLDHNPELTCGELVYCELNDAEQVAVVAVVDGIDLDAAERPVYMSGQYEMRGDVRGKDFYVADVAQLLSVGLTFSPAAHGARPINWRPGDIRERSARSQWPLSWGSSAPLLRRAADWRGAMQLRTRSAPERIVDRRRESALDNLAGRRAGSVHPSELEAAEDPHWQHRPLRHGPRGKVLRVR